MDETKPDTEDTPKAEEVELYVEDAPGISVEVAAPEGAEPEPSGFGTKVEDVERAVGLTTTVPVEVILAAGLRPVDLNNVFITSDDPIQHVQKAEEAGFGKNSCCWTKGIFSVARELGLKRVVAVVQGDCGGTHSLTEMLEAEGVKIIPFAYPFHRDRDLLQVHLERFAKAFETTLDKAEEQRERLTRIRGLAQRIDDMTWQQGRVTGRENHLWNVSCSDFFGDPDDYARRAGKFISDARGRPRAKDLTPLALLGIPPICDGLFEFLEERDARVVFNEVPRQFAMPFRTRGILDQYWRYTYPYDVSLRLADARIEIRRRQIKGIIHYVQSFCFRYPQDALIRRSTDLPVLTLECDRPGPLDESARNRIEAFLEMLGKGE